jgi:hypothetical protein
LKTQAILQHRSKKGQSAFRSAAHLSKGALGPLWTFALLRVVDGIRVIFDESRAVTGPVPYTKLFSAVSADLRCAEPWRPGIKMRFIEEGMSALGQKMG